MPTQTGFDWHILSRHNSADIIARSIQSIVSFLQDSFSGFESNFWVSLKFWVCPPRLAAHWIFLHHLRIILLQGHSEFRLSSLRRNHLSSLRTSARYKTWSSFNCCVRIQIEWCAVGWYLAQSRVSIVKYWKVSPAERPTWNLVGLQLAVSWAHLVG